MTYCIYSNILSDIFSGIYSDILSGICIWHIFWHSFWHFLAFYLVYLRRFFVVEVWRGTLIRSLRWRSGGNHYDPALAVRVQQGTLQSRACSWGPAGNTMIPSLLFRQGTLRSRACSWGPAGITLIQRLLFGSGGDHCDLELAVEVRRRRRRRRDKWHKI